MILTIANIVWYAYVESVETVCEPLGILFNMLVLIWFVNCEQLTMLVYSSTRPNPTRKCSGWVGLD